MKFETMLSSVWHVSVCEDRLFALTLQPKSFHEFVRTGNLTTNACLTCGAVGYRRRLPRITKGNRITCC